MIVIFDRHDLEIFTSSLADVKLNDLSLSDEQIEKTDLILLKIDEQTFKVIKVRNSIQSDMYMTEEQALNSIKNIW